MNLISSLPCIIAGSVPVVNGGDVRVVGNGDVLGDVGGQVPSLLLDRDRDVSPWANRWDGPTSSSLRCHPIIVVNCRKPTCLQPIEVLDTRWKCYA